MPNYDRRLDSDDVRERQQAEIEALRTCLIAANSESCGEYQRLRDQLDTAKASYEGQLRNTLAFKKEKEHLLEAAQYVKERLTKMTAADAVQHDAFVSMQICLAAAIEQAEGREP